MSAKLVKHSEAIVVVSVLGVDI